MSRKHRIKFEPAKPAEKPVPCVVGRWYVVSFTTDKQHGGDGLNHIYRGLCLAELTKGQILFQTDDFKGNQKRLWSINPGDVRCELPEALLPETEDDEHSAKIGAGLAAGILIGALAVGVPFVIWLASLPP